MKKLVMAALLAAQISPPAGAAAFSGPEELRAGAFGGLRIVVPFGGPAARREPIRAGLAFAPTARNLRNDGTVRTRIGEGLEFGLRTGRPVSLSVAGRDLAPPRLGAQQGDDGRDGGLSTGEILLIAGGVIVVTAGVAAVLIVDSINDNSE